MSNHHCKTKDHSRNIFQSQSYTLPKLICTFSLHQLTMTINWYSRTLIIRTPMCIFNVKIFNVKGVQISEFVPISKLSGRIHYLAS